MKTKNWAKWAGGIVVAMCWPLQLHAQWWTINSGSLLAGSDNNNPEEGCVADTYEWIVLPEWEIKVEMPRAATSTSAPSRLPDVGSSASSRVFRSTEDETLDSRTCGNRRSISGWAAKLDLMFTSCV